MLKKTWDSQQTEYISLFLMLAIALILFLCNLGNHYLWQDEAQTALISKTILTHGVPLGYDGKNFFSQEQEAEYGKNYIWKWHTWLPFYILAGFFKLFGINTFVARLPFALFGIGTVFLTYYFAKAMWKNKAVAMVAAALLLVSVPFLLLSRQCRYYSMTAFFSLWGLYSYIELMEKKKYAYATFVFSSVLLFHTHYIYCATLFAAVFLHALLFHRDRLLVLSILVATVVLINAPWIIWLSGMKYGRQYGADMFNIKRWIVFFVHYLFRIRYIFSPYLLLIVPVIAVANRIKTGSFFSANPLFWQKISLTLLFVFFNLLALTITSPLAFFRYLSPLIPPITIIIALLVIAAARVHPVLAIVIVAGMLFTSQLSDFLYEITHDYDGPIEGIVKYLNKNGTKDDIVAITYGDMPLKFYTEMRVVGGLTGEDLSLATQAKWVIDRKYIYSPTEATIAKYFSENLQRENYKGIVIGYPDIHFENREDPWAHKFRTVVNEDSVVIFRKIK